MWWNNYTQRVIKDFSFVEMTTKRNFLTFEQPQVPQKKTENLLSVLYYTIVVRYIALWCGT